MNDFWDFTLSIQQRCLLLAALTAAKKIASQPLESSSHNGQKNLDCVFVGHYLNGTLNFSYGSNVKTVNFMAFSFLMLCHLF